MQIQLTARQIQLEEEIDFKLRLAQVYKKFADSCPDNTSAKAYYKTTVYLLCDEAHELGLEHQQIRELNNPECDLFIQNQLS